MNTTEIKNARLKEWADQAQALGLVIEHTHSIDDYIERETIRICRQQVEVLNWLDVAQNGDNVYVYASRSATRGGKWRIRGYEMGSLVRPRELLQKHICWAIKGMGN